MPGFLLTHANVTSTDISRAATTYSLEEKGWKDTVKLQRFSCDLELHRLVETDEDDLNLAQLQDKRCHKSASHHFCCSENLHRTLKQLMDSNSPPRPQEEAIEPTQETTVMLAGVL